jgi:hypothetical protein
VKIWLNINGENGVYLKKCNVGWHRRRMLSWPHHVSAQWRRPRNGVNLWPSAAENASLICRRLNVAAAYHLCGEEAVIERSSAIMAGGSMRVKMAKYESSSSEMAAKAAA